jgi:Secretion system C-terminal sorting domain
MGCVTVTYDAPLHRYLMCISRPSDGLNCVENFDTYILESDALTGPWKMVHYLREFGTQAYFDNIPSKFISQDGKTVWLCYSANFGTCCGGHPVQNPPHSTYGMTLLEMKLIVDASDTVTNKARNIALIATASASSVYQGYNVSGVNDNAVGGYPGNISEEWATNNEKAGAWVQLNWNTPVIIDSIALWDRPNLIDEITSGTLTFSDGSNINVGSLEDSAVYHTTLQFPSKTITWVRFKVTGAKPSTSNVGLSEFAAYGKEGTTGIFPIRDNLVLLYPNPAKNVLFINNLPENSKLLIFDSAGNLIPYPQMTNNQIDISRFQSGIYIIKIETYNEVFTKKFVK